MITFPVTAEVFIADQEERAGRKFDDFQRELRANMLSFSIWNLTWV